MVWVIVVRRRLGVGGGTSRMILWISA